MLLVLVPTSTNYIIQIPCCIIGTTITCNNDNIKIVFVILAKAVTVYVQIFIIQI